MKKDSTYRRLLRSPGVVNSQILPVLIEHIGKNEALGGKDGRSNL